MPSVFVIDDEETNCAMVVALLKRDGIDADAAASVSEALAHLRHNEPDLVLLDLGMPRTDGLDLLDALMDEPRFENLRVVVFSGRNDPETVAEARRLGARDFIEKGAPWDEVRRRIRAQLCADPAGSCAEVHAAAVAQQAV